MSLLPQVELLVRLRAARLTRANRALAEARTAADDANRAARMADLAAAAAEAQLAADRQTLTHDLDGAQARLALVDRSGFLQAVARSAANDAVEQHRLCEDMADRQRRAAILARARHDLMRDQRLGLIRRAAVAGEERIAMDIEERRRPA
jgi:hypothetical protein